MSKPMSRCDRRHLRLLAAAAAAAVAAAVTVPVGAQTDLSTVPLPTYSSGTSSTDIKPNILFVLDDSGSMALEALPDWADDTPPNHGSRPNYLFRNSAYNGIYYNPAVTYLPPIRFNANGTRDVTTYPSQTGAGTATGADATTKPNWRAVKNDAYGVQSTGTANLTTGAYYWLSIPGEYCNSPALTNCVASSTPTATHAYPAPLRWCDSTALTNCRGLWSNTYNIPRAPAPRVATVTFANPSSAVVSGITVDGQQIMSAATAASSTDTAVASAVATAINNCALTQTGNCTTVGYQAYAIGTTVTIMAPGVISVSPSVATTGSVGVTSTAFARSVVPLTAWRRTNVNPSTDVVPGENLFVVITPTVNSYPYPGTATKAATRTDCAGTTCTYVEEMTNFANWYTYYRSRMQMMKTSTSRAFAVLDTDDDQLADRSRFRVGFLSINNNTGGDFVNLEQFNTAQKITWYSKLFAARPNNSTPLRAALSTAGRLYGGKLNGTTLNGSTVVDPLQFSCQRNFTILSTDGYWNGAGGVRLDGSTAIGNYDGTLPRPYFDGTVAQTQTRTSLLQQRDTVQVAQRGTLQRQTSQLQRRTSQLQTQTRAVQQRAVPVQEQVIPVQSRVVSLQEQVSGVQQRTVGTQQKLWGVQSRLSKLQTKTVQVQVKYLKQFRTNNNFGNTANWTVYQDYTNTSADCVDVLSGRNQTQCQVKASPVFVTIANNATCVDTAWIDCQTVDPGWTDATGACTPVAPLTAPNYRASTSCQYVMTQDWTNVGSCTIASANNTNLVARECQYGAASGFTDTGGSCTTVAKQTVTTNGTTWNQARDCQYTPTPGAWGNVGSCTIVARGTGTTINPATECQYGTAGAWTDLPGTCTPVTAQTSTANGQVWNTARACRYTPTPVAFATVASCQIVARGTTGTLSPATECQYAAAGTFTTVGGSCTPQAQQTSTANGTTWPTARNCQYATPGAWSSVASCTIDLRETSGTLNPARECQYDPAGFSAWADTSSTCTVAGQQSGTGNGAIYNTAVNCQYAPFTAWANAGSCTVANQSGGPSYTVTQAVACQTIITSSFANAPSCAVQAPDGTGASVQCQYAFAALAPTQVCTPTVQSGNFTNATVYQGCTTQVGSWNNVATCTPSATSTTYDANGVNTACQYTAWTGWSNASSCTPVPRSTSAPFTVAQARECQSLTSGGTANTLADVAAYYYNTDLRSDTATGADATGTCTGPVIAPATTANNLCTDNVPVIGRNVNTRQHMVTHGLALGAQGMMVYSPYQNSTSGQRVYIPDYWNQPSGDFYDVANGSLSSPSTGICPWQASGNCNWPTPSADSAANIDDLWHAAVNGLGSYFSAQDPASLADSLRAVLQEIIRVPRPGTAAAAATSNPNVTTADNFVFSSSYLSLDWYGELVMQRIGSDGRLGSQQWSAMQLLDCATTPWRANRAYAPGDVYNASNRCWVVETGYTSGTSFGDTDYAAAFRLTGTPVSRNILTVNASNSLVQFDWTNLDATQRAMFTEPAITFQSATAGLTQFCTVGSKCLSATAKTAAAGEALVNFLRGDRSNEGSLFRTRKRVLGDIVSSEARYVRAPLQSYADAGFSDYKATMATRTAMVYVGSNDGMLHAFDALTGTETWAFVPPAVLPEMYRLADVDYTSKRRYFVDGTPEVGDICPTAPTTACTGSQWRTILVGGLNLGGKAFYALDITNPASPRFLWQFTNANLGYSYSNPRITKLKSGRWVVIVASGYGVADGVGRLFVLDAATGALINTISNGVGTAAAESGLARITARAPTAVTNNTVEAVYGGDLLGNVWRFDVNGDVGASGTDAQLLVQLRGPAPGNAPQPITMRPTVTSISGRPVVMVGTGRYLGLTDLPTTDIQSIYAIKDTLGSSMLTTPRGSGSNFVQQTITDTVCPAGASTTVCSPNQVVRTATSNVVDWGTKNGWYVDLPIAGERAVTDQTLALGTLAFSTIVPQTSSSGGQSCTADQPPSAKSYLYYLNYETGGAIAGGNTVAGVFVADGVATRVSVFRNVDGTLRAITRISGLAPGAGVDGGTATTDSGNGNIRNCDSCIGTDMAGRDERQLLGNTGSSGSPQRRSWRILNGENN